MFRARRAQRECEQILKGLCLCLVLSACDTSEDETQDEDARADSNPGFEQNPTTSTSGGSTVSSGPESSEAGTSESTTTAATDGEEITGSDAETGDDPPKLDPEREGEVCESLCQLRMGCGDDRGPTCPAQCVESLKHEESRAGLACRVHRGTLFECLSLLGCPELATHEASEPDPIPSYPCEAPLVAAMKTCGDWLDSWLECEDGSFVAQVKVCDGQRDCPGGRDESTAEFCFACGNGSTIPLSQTCNGFPECADESDESLLAGCMHFFCVDGTVIPDTWACDGNPDCPDGSDEAQCR